MRNNLNFFIRPILYLIIGLSIITSCDKVNPLDSVELTVNDEIPKSPVLLHFVNANSLSNNQPSEFTVKINGKDANLVKMDGGSTNFQASHGFLPLGLSSNAIPSASNPVTFNVYAEIPGFAPVTQTISITSESKNVIDISAIELANPAPGTSVSVEQAILSDGESKGITLKTSQNSSITEITTVNIPTGTKLLDANGLAVSGSQLNSSIVYYSATSPTSYGAFPGGFNPTNVVDENGQSINNGEGIHFVSAGLVSINMKAGGSEIKKFSQPVKVSMEVNENTTNFETGENIKEGDTVPLWSLNEQTGAWKKEGIVTLTKNSSGKLVADFETSHLSCFNLDWFFYGSTYNTCNNPLTVKLHIGQGAFGYYDVALVTPNNQYLAAAHWEPVYDGAVVTFPNVANIKKAKIVISDFNLWCNPRLPILAETPLFNPCTQGSIDLTWKGPALPDYVNVTINVTGKCTNKSVKVLPSGWYYLYDYTSALSGKYGWTFLWLENGVIRYSYGSTITNNGGVYNIKLINGNQYYVYSWNNNNWYESGLFTLNKSNFTLPAGTGISGSGKYNTTTNTLEIVGTFNSSCK
jgi:hypothetical protein